MPATIVLPRWIRSLSARLEGVDRQLGLSQLELLWAVRDPRLAGDACRDELLGIDEALQRVAAAHQELVERIERLDASLRSERDTWKREPRTVDGELQCA